jgi:N4-gp56 family major capsid protein
VTTTNTGTTNFDKIVETLIRKQLEDELIPNLPHLMPGHFLKASFVKGTNATMRFLRMPYLAVTTNNGTVSAGTAPWLTEGTSPTAQALSFGYEEFTAYQAGQRVEFTDKALMESPLDLMAEGAKRVSRQAAATIDEYVGRILAAGTNVLYAGAGNTARNQVASTDVLTGSLVRKGKASLKSDSVPTFGDGTYHAVIHTNVVFDFEEDSDVGGWMDVSRYNGGQAILNGEIGKYAGVRFYESPSARVFSAGGAGGADIYSTIILGPDAYAFGDYGTLSTHYVAPGGHGDELAQVASLGWKAMFGAMLIDEAGARYVRIESASQLS